MLKEACGGGGDGGGGGGVNFFKRPCWEEQLSTRDHP